MKLLRALGGWLLLTAMLLGMLLVLLGVAYGAAALTVSAVGWVRWSLFAVALGLGAFVTIGHAHIAFIHHAEEAGHSVSMLPPIGGACLVVVALLVPWGSFEARMRFAWLVMLVDMSTISHLVAPHRLFRGMLLERNQDS